MFYQQTQSYGPPAGGESLEERRMREVILFNWYNPKDGGNRLQCENEAKNDQVLISFLPKDFEDYQRKYDTGARKGREGEKAEGD